jgi:predicted Fe-Mo cluster-binding NifX family protein
MKVTVSSSGKDLDSQIDPRFGRCAHFLIVNTDDMSFEVFSNESGALSSGTGIQSAQFVVSKGAKAVITGNCGPKAMQALSVAGVEMYLGNTGGIREALEKYKSGNLTSTNQANVPDHSGLAAGTGVGRGIGMGGGGGMGRGSGMGRGRKT